MFAGIVTLYAGLGVLTVGVIALARFCWFGVSAAVSPKHRLWRQALMSAALLLSNFPVAGGIIASVVAIETSYTVVVRNASRSSLNSVRVFGGGCDVSLGPVSPGEVVHRRFWIQHDGQLHFHAVSATTVHSRIIDAYVTNSQGGHTTVTVNADETITVFNNDAYVSGR